MARDNVEEDMEAKELMIVFWVVATVVILFFVMLVNKAVARSKKTRVSVLDKIRDEEIRLKDVPNNDIRRIFFEMYKERVYLVMNQDPRYYRPAPMPVYLRDVTSYCKSKGIKPIYPPDWKGERARL